MTKKRAQKHNGSRVSPEAAGDIQEVDRLLASAFEYHRAGSLDKAKELYRKTLLRFPDHPDALHLLGVIHYQQGDTESALRHITRAITLKPGTPEYSCNLGNVLRDRGDIEGAISCYREAIALKPDLAEAYNNLGACLRRSSRMQEAIECYQKALQIKPGYAAAYNNLGNILRETGNIDKAIENYRQALCVNPQYAEACFNLGNALCDKYDLEAAAACFRKAVTINPGYSEAYLCLGRLLRSSGNMQEAMECCRRALETAKDPGDAYHLLGRLFHETRDYQKACESFRKELGARPECAEAHNCLGMSLHHAGKPEDAISSYLKALDIDPESAETLNNLGIALHDTGRPEEAICSYKKAIAIDPRYAQAHNNLGSALHSIHRMQEAIDSFRQAILIQPDFVEAHNNLGLALLAEKRYEEALSCFDKALAVQPGFVDAYINSGNTFREQGLYSQALERFKKALELDPNRYDAHAHMAYVLTLQGKMDDAIRSYREALKTAPEDNSLHSHYLFALHYQDPVDFSELFRQHEQWGKRQKTGNQRTHVQDKTPGRRLRIGYVSPDFHTHSVGYFIETILASHDKDSFEIYCYSDVSCPDETTERMQSLVKNWRDISLLKDRQVEGMIQQDRIDILVDLAGHTANNRLAMFGLGPAPVQATYLGYPDTTGLPGMHYRITDALADPPGMTDHLYTEKLVRLPGCFLCYRPPVPAPDVGPPPCLKTGRITFGSFNNRSKITRSVIRVWSEILQKMPDSRLLIKAKPLADPDTRQALLDEFSRQGVQSGQIEFAGRIESRIEHLKLYNSIDIALDTFPYNGTTTTCEALWMGVPVVVLKGEAHMSRVGVSLLTNMGMEEFIAETPVDYVKKAVSLAKNPEKLSRLRQRQRDVMARSPLMDGQGFTRNLERAYREMWAHWCSQTGKPLSINPGVPGNDALQHPEKCLNEEQSLAANQEGERLFESGRMEDALRAFTRALEIDPSCLPALNNLGVMYWHTSNIPAAVQCFEHVLSLDPGNEDAAYNLQQIRTGNGCAGNGSDPAPALDSRHPSADPCLSITVRGGIQVCVPRSLDLMTPYVLIEQEDWFENEITFIRKILHQGMRVIDIGANYGLYTLTASRLVGCSGRVWAFEPTSSTAEYLRKSIALNHMTNIELVQAGLSDRKGTAMITLNSNSELNAVTELTDTGGRYETIELTSLDECKTVYGWEDIEFIKLDAEGQERNIVRGGRCFLSAHSPLIMFEHKHGDEINTGLIDDFSALGYQSYRLVPGLGILAPIGPVTLLDPYQLNLFCCKPDRARLLEDKGLLYIGDAVPPRIEDPAAWRQKIEGMPCFKTSAGPWWFAGKEEPIDGWNHYENALNYYTYAHASDQPAHARHASLIMSRDALSLAIQESPTIPRKLTFVRILSELGERQAALNSIDRVLKLLVSGQAITLSEPFLPVLERFDYIVPKDMRNWLASLILEFKEKTQAFSSFFTGQESLNNLEILRTLGYLAPEMERRRQLIRMRFGMQSGPVPAPVLDQASPDNLNPGFWRSGRIIHEACADPMPGPC